MEGEELHARAVRNASVWHAKSRWGDMAKRDEGHGLKKVRT